MHVYLIPVLLALFFALLANFAGGSLGAHLLNKKGVKGGIMPVDLTILPELVFSGITGAVVGFAVSPWIGLLAWVNTFYAFNTGHGTVLDPREAVKGRKQFLSRFVDPACRLFKQPLGGAFYHWLFMGLKGLWIGAAICPYGLPLLLTWPAAYKLPTGQLKELASGASFGACLGFFIIGRI